MDWGFVFERALRGARLYLLLSAGLFGGAGLVLLSDWIWRAF